MTFFEIDTPTPNYVLDTLAMGPKNPILGKFNQKEVLTEIDILLNNLKYENVSDDIMNDINVATLKYIKSCSNLKPPRHIIMTKRYLKENNLLAIPFDKGTGICVMKKDTYILKLKDILDLEQFEKVIMTRKNGREMCLKEEDRVNSLLHSLHANAKIDDELYKDLKSTGGQLPRLYGLAKVHKQNVPLRPVLSMPGSPYHKVANKVTEWLSVIPEAKINCSTQQTVENLKNVSLEPNEVVISFDVTSLYTNVPVKEAIGNAAEKLYSSNMQSPPVDKETFIALATISCTDVMMSTHEGTYKQIDGLAMGSPPAPLLANKWLSKFEPSIKHISKLFERYMDGILRTIRSDLIRDQSFTPKVEIHVRN